MLKFNWRWTRYQGLADTRQNDWASAELLEILLTGDGRLIGKTNILGVNLDQRGVARCLQGSRGFPSPAPR